jgi:hypothetical protein
MEEENYCYKLTFDMKAVYGKLLVYFLYGFINTDITFRQVTIEI